MVVVLKSRTAGDAYGDYPGIRCVVCGMYGLIPCGVVDSCRPG